MTHITDPEAEWRTPRRRVSKIALPVLLALILALAAGAALAVLVLRTDPDQSTEQLFVCLLVATVTGVGAAGNLLFGARHASPLADTLRAFRRGALAGLALAGAAVLQLIGAFSPANLAFLLLVLLIIEMIFLARRQDPSS